MATNIHIDDVRISAIADGLVYFETKSGPDTIISCMSVGKYRAFVVDALRKVDQYVAGQNNVVELACRGHG